MWWRQLCCTLCACCAFMALCHSHPVSLNIYTTPSKSLSCKKGLEANEDFLSFRGTLQNDYRGLDGSQHVWPLHATVKYKPVTSTNYVYFCNISCEQLNNNFFCNCERLVGGDYHFTITTKMDVSMNKSSILVERYSQYGKQHTTSEIRRFPQVYRQVEAYLLLDGQQVFIGENCDLHIERNTIAKIDFCVKNLLEPYRIVQDLAGKRMGAVTMGNCSSSQMNITSLYANKIFTFSYKEEAECKRKKSYSCSVHVEEKPKVIPLQKTLRLEETKDISSGETSAGQLCRCTVLHCLLIALTLLL